MRNLISAIGLICLAACGANDPPSRPPVIPITPAETAVAEAAMRSWSHPGNAGIHRGQVVDDRLDPFCAGPMVSIDETRAPSEIQAARLRHSAKGDKQLLEAVEDFLRKREQNTPTALLVEGIQGVDVQPRAEIEKQEDGEPFWASFYRRFPKSQGYGKLSRVGLSHDGTLAVIAHSILAGLLMGYGKYSVFEKVDGKWVPSSREIKGGWIS